jgi:hypothetical protein
LAMFSRNSLAEGKMLRKGGSVPGRSGNSDP